MISVLQFFRRALKLSTSDVMQHLDKMDRRQEIIEREIKHIKGRIDPLAELVESLRGELTDDRS